MASKSSSRGTATYVQFARRLLIGLTIENPIWCLGRPDIEYFFRACSVIRFRICSWLSTLTLSYWVICKLPREIYINNVTFMHL